VTTPYSTSFSASGWTYHKEEKSKAGTVPVRVIAYSRVILIKEAAAPSNLGHWLRA
jgi:hypothetical protein